MLQHFFQCGAKVILPLVLQAGEKHWDDSHPPPGGALQVGCDCDLCKSFTSMSAQSVLEHHSGCNVNYTKEHTEQEWNKKVRRLNKKKSNAWEQKSILIVVPGNSEESQGANWFPTPSIQWTQVDLFPRSSWVILIISSKEVFTQLHKLSCFCFN